MTKFYLKNPILKKLIQFVSINGFEPDCDNYISVIPDGISALVISIGKPYERTFAETNVSKKITGSHFVGIKSTHCFVRPNNGMKTISIRFRPGSLPFFVNSNLEELTDTIVDAYQLFGREIVFLEEQFSEVDNPCSVIEKVEDFLLARLNFNANSNEFLTKVKKIYRNPAHFRIEHLRDENISYKKLERDFIRNIGLTPKLFIDIVKFNYTASLLYSNPKLTLTEIAYKAEYYDQPHCIRSFIKKSGYSPGKFLKQKSPMFIDNLKIITDEFRIS